MLFYFHMDDDKEKMVEKYGDWARLMTESEAKSMLNDYGKVMQIMKWFLEGVFGEQPFQRLSGLHLALYTLF